MKFANLRVNAGFDALFDSEDLIELGHVMLSLGALSYEF